MGIQDRDYYWEHRAKQTKAQRGTTDGNSYGDALLRAEASRRIPENRGGGWAVWIACACLVVFILIACAAVWLGRR